MAAAWFCTLFPWLCTHVVFIMATVGISAPMNVTSEGDVDRTCTNKLFFCDFNAECQDIVKGNKTSLQCWCPDGFQGDGYLDGTSCTPVTTRCRNQTDCHRQGTCSDQGFCQCSAGYVGDGFWACDDMDECRSNPCHAQATCTNTAGSFLCTCDSRNNYEGNGFNCSHWCNDNNDCHPDAACLTRSCNCKPGYHGNGRNCTDINECEGLAACSNMSVCVNEPGRYRCDCVNGYLKTSTGTACLPAPKDCEDIRKTSQKVTNGTYVIDPDFTGPATPLQVKCEFRQGYAITELVVLNQKENSTGNNVIDYGTDDVTIQALLSYSSFCSQRVEIKCTRGFQYGTHFHWRDAFGNNHTSWAGASVEGMCACGQIKKCRTCRCGNNAGDDSDAGTFVDKTQLPVRFLRLPDVSRSSFAIASLRCGPRGFDIPQDCEGWVPTFKSRSATVSGPFYIYADSPVLVYCDFLSHSYVAVTEMQVIQEQVTFTSNSHVAIDYVQGINDVQRVVNSSRFCIQNVTFICKNSGITGGRTFVTVTSERRRLTYFPGAAGVYDSCGCGATQSCENSTARCNCDITDGQTRRDFGSIINKEDLPIVGLTTSGGPGLTSVFQLSHLRCGPLQFDIEVNCEKINSRNRDSDPYNYTYFIDPDGTQISANIVNQPPFLVECQFLSNPDEGITIIHPRGESYGVAFNASYSRHNLTYLQVTLTQLLALKQRSTYCTQDMTVDCRNFNLNAIKGGWYSYNGTRYSLTTSLSTCTNGLCLCNASTVSQDRGVLDNKELLPVTAVSFDDVNWQRALTQDGEVNVRLGPLKCHELYRTCDDFKTFVAGGQAALGEVLPDRGSAVYIDPDAAGIVPPFGVRCDWPDSVVIVVPPATTSVEVRPGTGGRSQCFDITYTDQRKNRLSVDQLSALMDKSVNCFQQLELQCQYARAFHMVNYTTCNGVTQTGWAGSAGQDSCACGVGGHCTGGSQLKCNCDVADGVRRVDGGVIINKMMLPVCQVCLSLDALPATENAVPFRRLSFTVSNLICHPGDSRHVETSCQLVRQKETDVTEDRTEIVYMHDVEPIPVGCYLKTQPPVGQLVVFPKERLYQIQSNYSRLVKITVQYFTVNITTIHVLMMHNVYCSQRVFFFCLPSSQAEEMMAARLGDNSGWVDIDGVLRNTWDSLTEEEVDKSGVCHDYAELCGRCGQPAGFVVHEKIRLPITGLTINVTGNVTLVIDTVRCTDVFDSCYTILADRTQKQNNQGFYTIDPDGAGGGDPFSAYCTFSTAPQLCAVTKVSVDAAYNRGVRGSGLTPPNIQTSYVTYGSVSVQQLTALTRVSRVCWQPVQYYCRLSPLTGTGPTPLVFYTDRQELSSRAFGTGDRTDFTGCACSLTGTCQNNGRCHCDANSTQMLTDSGIISVKELLPVTTLVMGGQTSPLAEGVMRVGDVMCSSNTYCQQFPKNCHEALQWKSRNGVNYNRSGEYFIQPFPDKCSPFPVYCQFDFVRNVGFTRIVSKTRGGIIAQPRNITNHEYFAPSMQHIQCLMDASTYCAQPVSYDCYKAKFLGGGVWWKGRDNRVTRFWGDGDTTLQTCACGKYGVKKCHGDTPSVQSSRKCNCDANDAQWRRDAGVLYDKARLPVLAVDLSSLPVDADSRVNVTIGDLICGQVPIGFDSCQYGFHDCADEATCRSDSANGYSCACKAGYQGKKAQKPASMPDSNGRQCFDDDECTYDCLGSGSTCLNTPGSFNCSCLPGYYKAGPTSCNDIDECKLGIGSCDVNARCINEQGSYKCVCNPNYRGTGEPGNCQRVGTCTVFGDPHEQTFDGRWLDVMGSPPCFYIMATTDCGPAAQGASFSVLMKPWQRDPSKNLRRGVTWVQSVKVYYDDHVVEMLQGRRVVVDGMSTSGYSQHGIKIYDDGRQLVLLTAFGIEVTWDGKESVRIVAPQSRDFSLCGICGNFNGNASDDMTVGPACRNVTGSVTTNVNVLGHSWVDPQSIQTKPECQPQCWMLEPPPPPCRVNTAIAQHQCDKVYGLATSPFANCLQTFSREELQGRQRACVYDLCSVEGDMAVLLCFHAESLVEECQLNREIKINNWRKAGFCHLDCPANMTYKVCGPDPSRPHVPPASCLQIRAPTSGFSGYIQQSCSEGCFCNAGYVQEGQRCIREDECGCFYNGTYIKQGEVITGPDCGLSILCTASGLVVNTNLQCGQNASCIVKDSIIGCYCNPGFIGDGFNCSVDPCYNKTCGEHMECFNGECRCLPGFTGDCKLCQDIDECAANSHNCALTNGQVCNNINGSFTCSCDSGYILSGDQCEDIDECALGIHHCPPNTVCINKPGFYACACCVGYTLNNIGDCVLEEREESQYIALNHSAGQCCSCNAPACSASSQVCGSDGKTYSNLKSMVQLTCTAGRRVRPMYMGACQRSCGQVICEQPFAQCRIFSGVAMCFCPVCDPEIIKISDVVCGSDTILYRSECEFRAVMCAHNNSMIRIVSMSNCQGGGGNGENITSTAWSSCSVRCGEGVMRRTVTSLLPPYQQFNVTAICYIPCQGSACDNVVCERQEQECQVTPNGPVCLCPDCEAIPVNPVCGFINGHAATFPNPCALKARACEINMDFFLLSNSTCPAEPVQCAIAANFQDKIDTDGCRSVLPLNYGRCSGGCGPLPAKCCYASSLALETAPFYCPANQTIVEKQVLVTKGCECALPEEQQALTQRALQHLG